MLLMCLLTKPELHVALLRTTQTTCHLSFIFFCNFYNFWFACFFLLFLSLLILPLGWTSWEWILRMPILVRRLENWFKFKALVKRSANWDCVLMSISFITPTCTLSLTMWQSISMCFVRPWNTGLVPIYMNRYLTITKQ